MFTNLQGRTGGWMVYPSSAGVCVTRRHFHGIERRVTSSFGEVSDHQILSMQMATALLSLYAMTEICRCRGNAWKLGHVRAIFAFLLQRANAVPVLLLLTQTGGIEERL